MAGNRAAKDSPMAFEPGVVSNLADRDAANRYKDSNRVRWHKGLAEKVGGWIRQTLTGANGGIYIGVARALRDWSSLDTQQWISIGTHCKLYVVNNRRLSDITPMRKASNTIGSLSVTMGSPIITITDPDHRARTGDHIVITASDPIGGFSVSGIYDIDTIPTPDTLTVTFTSNFNSTATGGGSVTIEYDISCGLAQNGERRGYGTGLFGMGTYGTPRPVGQGVPARMRNWSLQNWGEDLLGAPTDGELYWWDKTTGPNSRAVLIPEAPGAIQWMLVNPQNRHVLLLGCTGLDGVPDPMRLRWCSQEDFRVWIPATGNTAGGKRLDYGSRLVTGVQSRSTNYVWSDTQMYSVQYVGPPDIFAVIELGSMKIVGPNAAVDKEGVAYVMAFDDFMIYDGTLRVLLCEIHTKIFGDEDRNVEGNFDRTQAEGVYCSPYSPKNEVTWWYPGTDGLIHYATYNTVLERWYGGTMERTAYHDVSEAITGYKTNPYGVNGGYLYKHEVGTDEVEGAVTTPQAWFLETYDINVGGSDAVFIINAIVPNFDRFSGRMRLLLKKKAAPQERLYQTRGPYTIEQDTLRLGVRCKGSQIAMRFESMGELGEDWRMGIFQLNATPYGGRVGANRSIPAPVPPGAVVLSGETIEEDENFAEVVLLLTANTGMLIEWSGVPHVDIINVEGNSGISAAQIKFDLASYHNKNEFVDHHNYVDAYDDVDLTRFALTGPFTVEGWFFWVTDGGGEKSTIVANSMEPSAGYFFLGVHWDAPGFLGEPARSLSFAYDTSGYQNLTDLVMSFGTWTHVAITRDASNVVRVFLGGVPSATQPVIPGTFGGVALDGFTHLTICEGVPFISADFDGYWDQVRVTNGICRYISTFTPPTEPFPTS